MFWRFAGYPTGAPTPEGTPDNYIAMVAANYTTGQSFSSGFVFENIEFDTEVFSDNWSWTPGSATFTVPSGVNAVAWSLVWGETTGFADCRVGVRLNGTEFARQTLDNYFITSLSIHGIVACSASDNISFTRSASLAKDANPDHCYLSLVGYFF